MGQRAAVGITLELGSRGVKLGLGKPGCLEKLCWERVWYWPPAGSC